MMESCTVRGLEELKANLMRIAKEASDEETDRAILGIGMEMRAKMQQRAHPGIKSSVVAKPFNRKRGDTMASAFVAIDRKIDNGNLAHLFEFGTAKRFRKGVVWYKPSGGIAKGDGFTNVWKLMTGTYGYTGFIKRQPFFRPVVDEYKGGKFLDRLADVLKKRIERGRRSALASFDAFFGGLGTGE